MPDWLAFLVTIAAGAAAVFGYLVLQRVSGKDGTKSPSRDDPALAIREEAERGRRATEEQLRGLRQELGESQRGAQETLLGLARDLGRSASEQDRRAGELLRDALRSIEARLDGASGRQASELGAMRQELGQEGRRVTEALLKGLVELRSAQAAEAEVLVRRLAEVGTRIESEVVALKDLVRTRAAELDAAGDRRQRALAEAIGAKFGHIGDAGSDVAGLREALGAGLQRLDQRLTEALSQLGVQQVTRLEQVSQSLRALSEAHAAAQEAQREALKTSLEAMRQEAASKLEDLKRLKELETENARLRRAIADLTLDKIALNEALKTKS